MGAGARGRDCGDAAAVYVGRADAGIPKRQTVVRLELPLADGTLGIDVHGNQVRYALPARATRKHKAKRTIEL